MAAHLLQRPSRILWHFCVPLIAFVSGSLGQQPQQEKLPVIPISEAVRDTNDDSIPDRLGQPVLVEGVLTSDPARSGTDTWLINLQDVTAGILLVTHNSDLDKDLNTGDAVQVRGILSQYKGAEELQATEVERQVARPAPACEASSRR